MPEQLNFIVAGVKFRKDENPIAFKDMERAIYNEFIKGEVKITFELQPGNKFDANAVKVMAAVDKKTYFLGYVPKTCNKLLLALMKAGSYLEPRLEIYETAQLYQKYEIIIDYDTTVTYDDRVRLQAGGNTDQTPKHETEVTPDDGIKSQRFLEMLQSHPEALSSKQTFSSLLRDYFPQNRMAVNLLINLFEMGIHTEIDKTPEITKAFGYRFVKRLMDEYGVTRENADNIVGLFCKCYGEGNFKPISPVSSPTAF